MHGRILVVLLLAAGVVAACKGKPAPSPEPASGAGLAGSPPVDLAAPVWTGPDVGGLPVVDDVATAPAPEATVLQPEPPDAVAPPPPPPPEAVHETAPPEGPPDAGTAIDAARRDVSRREAATEAAVPPDAAREAAAPPDAPIDTGSRPDAAPEATPQVDAARPTEATAVDTSTAPDAGAAGPPAADAARTFASQQRNIQRCAEAEGRGELRVHARVRGSDGRVRDVTIDSSYTDAAEQCVRNLVATLRFPAFAGESAALDYTYVIAEMPVEADAGAGATLQQQLEAEESRLRRLAKRCIVGVTGDVTVHVWLSAETQTATLRRVDGDVTAEQRECLEGVLRSANLPNIPTSTERSLRIQ